MNLQNENSSNPHSFYKVSIYILGLIGLYYILYIGQDIIIPLAFALIIAILLDPLVTKMTNRGINRTLAITLAVTLAFVFTGSLLYFIGRQLSLFTEAIPQLAQKLDSMLADVVKWFSDTFNISIRKVNEWIVKQKAEGISNTPYMIGQTLSTLTSFFVVVLLLPIYIFLFLYYKPLLRDFISQLFERGKGNKVGEILQQTRALVQSYLVGLMLEALMVAALNAGGLFVLGIDYALLLGVIGALLNIIPYVGGIVAIALPMILALATKSPVYAFYVFIWYMIVQFIDNNFIVTMVVATKIKINALVSIVIVFIGNAIWGVSGMFLSLPLVAILKVIFDRVESLKPFGYLIGDVMPIQKKSFFKEKKSKAQKEK